MIANRYRVGAALGRGGSAEVLEVIDEPSGDRRALKLLTATADVDEESLVAAFHREFQLLTELRHPHLVTVHDFGILESDGRSRLWFTMDLVDGLPIDRALPRNADWPTLARVVDAVLSALEALHLRGWVHGDVTCGNILVGDVRSDPPAVRLMDLGLATLAGRRFDGVIHGTVATLAPELMGGGAIDGRADLYALGCVLYRVVTGQDPFVAASPWEILRAHASLAPISPRELNPELPVSLEQLILALLAKSPAARPATARIVRQAIAPFTGHELAAAPLSTRRLAPAFVGREREMTLLSELIAQLETGHGTGLLITGAAGVGRTRVLEEFRLQLRLAGIPAVRVRADELSQRPLAAIDRLLALLDDAALTAQPTPGSRIERLSDRLERGREAVLVDDVTELDPASQEVLHELVRRRADAGWGSILIATFPSRETGGWGDVLLERSGTRLLRLRPLDLSATTRMAATMLGRIELPSAWSEWLWSHSGGVPMLVEETIDAWVEAGGWDRDPDLREPPPRELGPSTRLSRSLEALQARYRAAGDAERAIVEALAIAGQPIEMAELRELAPQAAQDPDAVGRLVENGLVRRGEGESGGITVGLTTRALADALAQQLPRAARQMLHRRRADSLSRRSGATATRAFHLAQAGQEEEALPLWVEAAHAALAERLPTEALRLTQRALATAGPPTAARAALWRAHALALAAAGLGTEAGSAFQRAIELAREAGAPEESAATLLAAGSFRGERGEGPAALAALEQALALRDELGDVAGGAQVLVQIGQLLARSGRAADAEARWASALSQAQRTRDPELQADVLVALGEYHAAAGRHERAAEQFRAAEIALADSGRPSTRHAVRRGKALALAASRRWRAALDDVELLVEESRRARDRDAEADALELGARFAAALGQRREALRRCEQAQQLLLRLGRAADAVRVGGFSARLLLERGQLRAALDAARGVVQLAERVPLIGVKREAALALAWVEASLGHAEAVSQLMPVGDDEPLAPHEQSARQLVGGLALLRTHQPDRARGLLQEACFMARRQGQELLEADALIGLAEAYLDLRDEERASLALRRVRQIAESLGDSELLARSRVLGAERELARDGGDPALAADEAEAAGAVLLERERLHELWRAHAALAAAALRNTQPQRAETARVEALRWLEALMAASPEEDRARIALGRAAAAILAGAANTVGTAPRAIASDPLLARRIDALERLLAINRALNSTLDLRSQLEVLLDTAIELGGAERGFVLLEDGSSTAIELARGTGGSDLVGADREFSRGVALQVMQAGEPLTTLDAQADERLARSASVHALRLRAVLAVPLRVRGPVVGALVLDSRQAGASFDPLIPEVLAQLGEQAGIALANARLVEALRRQAEEIARLNERLSETVEEQRVEILEKQSNLELRYRFDNLLGASPPMQKVYRALDKIIPTDIPVLVTGESGTGKDLVARVLHYNGPRSKQRFVTVNCAALTDTLLESELFGHRRGAFTGADRDRKGLFEQAAGGTLFLDEIGEMPLALQPKLLRAIQFGEVRRVGEDDPRHVDVRIVAATNRDLSEQVRAGRFREDLMYRLDVARVHLAPLRERLEDLGLLVDHFLQQQAEKSGQPRRSIEPAALRLLLRHHWPGNVRELENEVIKLAAFCHAETLTELDLFENAAFLDRSRAPLPAATAAADIVTLERAELEQIRQALRSAGGNRTKAAEALGIDRSTLYRKLKRIEELD